MIDLSARQTRYDLDLRGNMLQVVKYGILLHDDEGTRAGSIPWLTDDPNSGVSCDYYVDRDGQTYKLAPDGARTWHAGAADGSSWYGHPPAAFGIVDGNRLIGIEMEHLPGQDWPKPQLAAAWTLCRGLVSLNQFPRERIGLHRWFAPSRKSDPVDLDDQYWQGFIDSLYRNNGTYYRVTGTAGANIRQGPGTSFNVAAVLEPGSVFYSDSQQGGETVSGNSQWIHYAGADLLHPQALGFIWAGIAQSIKD